ncbi:hypothetical protein, conserved [Leishmania tarentolae]|uniref:Uncharacterized protein n=1 Tax=Leishmania tarentolae TaxID=5689 RepID=A0A640KQY7_LEITA|nr:hypothetical protein, conserved [Leishmania tarentolae]
MQQHNPKECIVPTENWADATECARPSKGDIHLELGHDTQHQVTQSKDGEKDVQLSECNGADTAGPLTPPHKVCEGDGEEDGESYHVQKKVDDTSYSGSDGLSMLWTMDEETVLLHSSQVSLERIRRRLEVLLLGVSDAIRMRKTRDTMQRYAGDSPERNFQETMLAADHAFRRIIGESFVSFSEEDAAQMMQLCTLADKGVTDCDELVRNAVVVLQALMHDGEGLHNLEQFCEFVSTHRDEITSRQWQQDFVTALRSLALGFLRRPRAVIKSYGHSVNQIVQRETLYVALLRFCGGRSLGSTPAPARAGEKAKQVVAKTLSSHELATIKLRTSRLQTPLQWKPKMISVHTPKGERSAVPMQRPSI